MTSFQLVGMGKNGVQIMTSNDLQNLSPHSPGALREPVAQPLLYKIDQAALEGFGRLFSGLVMLRTHEALSSISELEAVQLANSLCYVLGSSDLPPASLNNALANDPFTFYVRQVKHLEERVEALLVIRKRVCELMPPLRNVSLRDTLGSIGKIRALYDIRFRAHEVPCDIQYQLSCPVYDSLMGIDYLEAWISELLKEAIWIAQFTPGSCISVLERFCPDYRGLHVNLSTFLNFAKIYRSASGSDVGMLAERSTEWSFA